MSVVLFHLGGYVPGGFVGVDIFFVISGFLISGIIFDEAGGGRFSIAGFYERRARRILPAFVAVSLLTLIAAYFVLLPQELTGFARSLLASIVFVSNNYFYATTSYFAPAADTLPLLHYWSLGVEEQFYIVFPLLVLASTRLSGRAVAPVVAVLAIASAVACVHVMRLDPAAAFYLLPFRAFELLIGSLVALPGVRPPRSARFAGAVSWFGLAMIVAALVLFGRHTAFPSINALLPTVGTALVLWGSDREPNACGRLLDWRPLPAIGRVSYSLYLVHWPLIVFAVRLFPAMRPDARAACLLPLSLLAGWASYVMFEQPFRRRLIAPRRWQLFSVSLGSLAVLGTLAVTVVLCHGFPGRLDDRVNRILAYLNYNPHAAYRDRVCFLGADQPASALDLSVCLPPKAPGKKAILWGDSIVAQFYQSFRQPLEQAGYALGQLTASLCAPILDYDVADRPKCRDFNDVTFQIILREKPDLLIMGASWPADSQINKLEGTVARLEAAGIHPVILGPQPIYRQAVPALLAERLRDGDSSTVSGPDLGDAYIAAVDGPLRRMFAHRADVKLVSMMDTICPGHRCPMTLGNGEPMQFDIMHLTADGSDYFAKKLIPAILGR